MSSRSNRRPQAQVSLNNVESLLLAQAVWELGAGSNSWTPISKILAKHPLVTRPKAFFNPQSCHVMYEALMKEAGLEINESSNAPHAPVNLQLARKHYRSRFLELQSLILAEEIKFKTILKEIEDIRTGIRESDSQAKNERATESTQRSPIPTKSVESADGLVNNDDPDLETNLLGPGTAVEGEANSKDKLEERSQIDAIEVGDGKAKESSIPLGSDLVKSPNTTNQVLNDLPSSPKTNSEDANVGDTTEEERAEEIEILETTGVLKEDEAEEHPADRHEEVEEEEAQDKGEIEDAVDEEERTEETGGQPRSDRGTDRVSPVPTAGASVQSPIEGKDALTDANQSEDEDVDLTEQMDVDIESELANTPAMHTAGSEDPEEKPTEEEIPSDVEEPVVQTRRSSRRRKSSAASVPPPQTRKRLRSKAQFYEIEPRAILDSDNDIDIEIDEKEDTPAIEDERTSSPFEGITTRRRDSKRKASFLEQNELSPDKKRAREDSEPVDEDGAGSNSHTRTRATRHTTKTEEQVALKRFQNVIGMLHSQISQHRNGNIFHNPIKNSDAPDYHEFVKRPMDLKTIKTRVKDGVIANSLEFQRDIYLMFANAMMYNRPGSGVHAMAEDMMLESEGQINAFRQTEGLVKRGQRP